MERLKRAYAGEEPEDDGLYEGFEEDAVAAWLACKSAGLPTVFPAGPLVDIGDLQLKWK